MPADRRGGGFGFLGRWVAGGIALDAAVLLGAWGAIQVACPTPGVLQAILQIGALVLAMRCVHVVILPAWLQGAAMTSHDALVATPVSVFLGVMLGVIIGFSWAPLAFPLVLAVLAVLQWAWSSILPAWGPWAGAAAARILRAVIFAPAGAAVGLLMSTLRPRSFAPIAPAARDPVARLRSDVLGGAIASCIPFIGPRSIAWPDPSGLVFPPPISEPLTLLRYLSLGLAALLPHLLLLAWDHGITSDVTATGSTR